MTTQHTPGTKPLTQREQRTLDRLQIKWSKKTITAEEKAYALALSERAWQAERSAVADAAQAQAQVLRKLATWINAGMPIDGEGLRHAPRLTADEWQAASAAIAKATGGAA